MKLGKKEIKLTKKKVFILVGLLFLISTFAITSLLLFKHDSVVPFEKIDLTKTQTQVKFPDSVWKKVEKDLAYFQKKSSEAAGAEEVKEEEEPKNRLVVVDKKELQELTERIPELSPFAFKVLLIEKTVGILNDKNIEISFPPGGGILDLAKYVEERPVGSFYLKVVWDFKEKLVEKSKIYFISHSKQRVIDGKTYGSGCDHFFDLTSFWFESMTSTGLLLNTSEKRHLSLITGTYYFTNFPGNKVFAAQLEVIDSRYRDLLCIQ